MPKHIVAIDDDPHVLELLHAVLTDEGYRASTLGRGDTAFEYIQAARPDAVILDIRMERPGSGWEVLDLLTHCPNLRGLPIIVCSADITQLDGHAGELADAGCGILRKPFDLDDLLGVVRERVGNP